MEPTFEIRLIKDMVDRLDPSNAGNEEDPGYRAAVVLLAAVQVGPVVNELVRLTGYESGFVSDIFARMCRAGLWSATKVSSDHWLAEDGDTIKPVAFWTDVLVATGLLKAQSEGPNQTRYWAAIHMN